MGILNERNSRYLAWLAMAVNHLVVESVPMSPPGRVQPYRGPASSSPRNRHPDRASKELPPSRASRMVGNSTHPRNPSTTVSCDSVNCPLFAIRLRGAGDHRRALQNRWFVDIATTYPGLCPAKCL